MRLAPAPADTSACVVTSGWASIRYLQSMEQPIRGLDGPADVEHEPYDRHSASVCSNTSRVSYVPQARHHPVAPCINEIREHHNRL
jgi:hypothetical protein